jgi:hypothetical protein
MGLAGLGLVLRTRRARAAIRERRITTLLPPGSGRPVSVVSSSLQFALDFIDKAPVRVFGNYPPRGRL